MIDTPQVTQSRAVHIAYIPLKVPAAEIRAHMGPGISEVLAAVAAQGIEHDGQWFTHHMRRPTDIFDFKICVPVKTPVSPIGRVLAGELPATNVARTIYRGSYEGLGAAWGEFMKWIEASGLKFREDLWEVYIKWPESGPDPSEWATELNRPLL